MPRRDALDSGLVIFRNLASPPGRPESKGFQNLEQLLSELGEGIALF
jgi:hypothetical protein